MHWDPIPWFVFLICTGTATGSLARSRGRSFYRWFIFGAFAWPVLIPWLLFAKSQVNDRPAATGTMPVTLVAGACAIAVYVVDSIFGQAVLPNCDYYINISALNKTMSASSAAKAGDPEIITINNIKEISRSKTDLHCTATARLGNATDVPIEYRFFIDGGRLLNEVHRP
jgi:hypothetical protein